MFVRRHWIPPGGLLFSQACHGVSWLLLLWIAIFSSTTGLSSQAIAWIHLVALGWFTMAALSVLLHAIPAFTDVRWRHESVARACVAVFAAGVVAFAIALGTSTRFAGASAALVFAALTGYVAVAWATLAQARAGERVERAIARALAVTLFVLIAVGSLGLVLALVLSGVLNGAWVGTLPAAHANLGFFGWLSLLVYGVSARTVGPICGARSRRPWMHVIVGTATLTGAALLCIGLAFATAWLTWTGAVLVGLGALAYAADIAGVLAAATVTHRPPQAFIAAALFWLLVAVALGGFSLAGYPCSLAYGFALLIGWIGQMVNAHIFHIGTRLIATVYRGESDETPPAELLDVRLEWGSFALFQVAIGAIVCGLAFGGSKLVLAGAALGMAGWCATIANLAIARARAR